MSKTTVSQTLRSVQSLPESVEPVPKAARKDQASLSAQWVDNLSLQQKSEYDRLFAELFFRTRIPFAIIENAAMKNFIRAIRPAYASQMPNRKSLSGSLLDDAYDKLKKKLAGDVIDEKKRIF